MICKTFDDLDSPKNTNSQGHLKSRIRTYKPSVSSNFEFQELECFSKTFWRLVSKINWKKNNISQPQSCQKWNFKFCDSFNKNQIASSSEFFRRSQMRILVIFRENSCVTLDLFEATWLDQFYLVNIFLWENSRFVRRECLSGGRLGRSTRVWTCHFDLLHSRVFAKKDAHYHAIIIICTKILRSFTS